MLYYLNTCGQPFIIESYILLYHQLFNFYNINRLDSNIMDLQSERAIRLVEVNATGKYVLSEEGKLFISKIQGPIAVISVAGMYRTGKSYLLNRMLLNRSNGFGVGPTVNPCTKGLWCWNKTIVGKTADGESINVIVIDTEGIGALDQDQTHDTRIFTLAILCASAFIYNSTGSIDENALQNLSLVVNLTKNIQLNTNKSEQEEDDPEQLAEHFPAFYWVVRDFSLQLINSEGDQITPREYLERALAPQKGFSDDVEEKNRIRRLLSSFFKERQCFTLVRPLVDQKKLQHLDQLDLDQLRPEFVDQVMNFRRRILGRVRPKYFKGKQLDGSMYLCLLNSYVTAINNGAVPNIENAWNYMCQEKCAQAFEQSLSYFNEQSEKSVKSLFPSQEQFLVDQLKQIKQKACELFEKNSVGDKIKFHLKQLRQNLQHKIDLLRCENEKHSENMLRSYFKKNIVEIENRLRLRQYATFEEFMKQLNQFYINLLENGPSLPKKQSVFLSLLKKVIPAAADVFLKDKTEQFKNYKAISQQKQLNHQLTVEQLKKDFKQFEEKSKQRISKLDREKIDLQVQLEDLKKITEEMKQKMSMQTEKWQNESKLAMEASKKKEEIYNEKIIVLNQQISQIQSQMMNMKKDNEKESALITLKNKQLQSELQQLKRKQVQSMISLKNIEMSNSENVKSITQQYEQKLKERQIEIRQLKLNLNDLEQHSKLNEQQISQLKSQTEDQLIKLKLTLNKKEADLQKTIRQKQDQQRQMKRVHEQETKKLRSDLIKNMEKNNEIEKLLKTEVEGNSAKERNYKTQLRLIEQQKQFIEAQAKEYKQQIIKIRKQCEDRINSVIEETAARENNTAMLQQQAQSYQQRLSLLKSSTDQSIRKLNTQYQQLSKQYNQSLKQNGIIKTKLQAKLDEKQRMINQLQEQMSGQGAHSQSQLTLLQNDWRQKERSLIDKISKLENQMEDMKQQMLREQRQQHEKSEEVVLQLRNYYEIEKEKLEAKIVQQKEKHERKIGDLRSELEEKLREQTMELQSEYQFLKEKFTELEEELMKQKTNRKIQVDIKNKQIQNLEKNSEEMKSKLDNKQVQLLNKIDRLQKEQSTEKQSLYAKIEQLLTKQSKIEKQRSGLNHSKQQLQKLLQIKEKNVEELKFELLTIKQKIEAEKENEKSARNDMSTKLMQQRVQFEKKTALLSQENEYLKIKIEESDKQISSIQIMQQERLRKLKQQYSQQLRAGREKAQQQLESIEAKYEKIKKSGKEKQASMQKTISQLEKELAISNEKNTNMIDKLKSFEEKQMNQNEQHNSMILSVKAALNKQKQALREQLENEQRQREKIETEKSSMNASYQQQKALLENKNKHLEQQKQRYRQDYEDTKNKLQLAIDVNRKKWNQEKTTIELAHSEHVAKIQKKFWQEKQQLSENMKRLEIQYENKMKSLESENRVLSEKLAMQEQNKMGSQNISDRKLKQLTDNEKKLQMELDRLKNLRQNDLFELQNQEKERQSLKAKLKQKQQKYRAMQKQKQHLFYDLQKQKAKWKMQKDGIMNKTDEQKEIIQKQQRQIEKLQRQNEKLKVERKCQKTSMQSMNRFGSNFTIDRTSRSSLEQSVLKENSNNTSQISDTSIFFRE